jgi:hypothetical protein
MLLDITHLVDQVYDVSLRFIMRVGSVKICLHPPKDLNGEKFLIARVVRSGKVFNSARVRKVSTGSIRFTYV